MMRKKIIASYLSAGVLMLLPLAAHAAGLGKLSVKSALGQPLNAEIELLAENKDELAALSARLASDDAFREAKIDPAAALYNLKFTVAKTPNGRPVLKVTSSKPINDPFLDMLIELDWATGRMVREYTVLLDPPGSATRQTAVAPLEVTPATTNDNVAAQSRESAARSNSSSAAQPKPSSRAATARKSTRTAEKPAAGNAEQSTAQTYGPVKRGDTLAAIASQTKPDGVNLEQMLVGLFRENRKAFDGNNMNRLKTGKILKLPSKEQAAAIPATEAVRDIKLQSADWQSYRQKLAGAVVQQTAVPEKSAQAVGKIMPKVEDKAAQTQPGKDVLTLSKGEAPATGGQSSGKDAKQAGISQDKLNALQENVTAQQKALQDANNRVAALEKNIQDMQRLLDIKSQALAELQKNARTANPNAAPAKAPASVVPQVSVKPASPPAQPVIPKPVTPTPVQASQADHWYDSLNPLYLGGAALAALLLALLALMMHGKRRRKGLSNFEDSIMAGTDIHANTIYGTQGGGTVNTNNTSFLTDFSQAGLGTIDTHDVDPIAEAEVYMAYGRDAQAEEILKEALIKDPGRHEIHLKLLEIYAARKNLPAFESVATELYAALGAEMTPVWAKAAEMGRKLDPNNPLYNDTGDGALAAATHRPAGTDGTAIVTAAGMATAALATRRRTDTDEAEQHYLGEQSHSDAMLDFPHLPAAAEASPHEEQAAAHLSEDSSLDFTHDAERGIIADAVEKHAAHEDSVFHELDSMLEPEVLATSVTHDKLDFPDLDFTTHDLGNRTQPAPFEPEQENDSGLDFDFDLPETDAPLVAADTAPALDFSDISLDLNDIGDMSETAVEPDEAFQEAATKLDLARVYHEMGDKENAREILQEVMQEGNATQKEDAQMLLAQIG